MTLNDFLAADPKKTKELCKRNGLRFFGDALKQDERLSESGNEIYCTKCGELKLEKRYSRLVRDWMWMLPESNRDGCRCEREARQREWERQHAGWVSRVYRDDRYMRVSKGYLSYCEFTDDYYKKQSDAIVQAMRQVYAFCNNYLKNRESNGLYVYSLSPGLCKTSMMACARNLFLERAIPSILTNVEEIVEAFNGDSELFRAYEDVDVLIIDDIGIQDPKESWGTEMGKVNNSLYELLNSRMLKDGKPTLFTSNFSIPELLERGIKPQTVDRIRGIVNGNVMKISGQSVRGTK